MSGYSSQKYIDSANPNLSNLKSLKKLFLALLKIMSLGQTQMIEFGL